jgi:hypothetical protein
LLIWFLLFFVDSDQDYKNKYKNGPQSARRLKPIKNSVTPKEPKNNAMHSYLYKAIHERQAAELNSLLEEANRKLHEQYMQNVSGQIKSKEHHQSSTDNNRSYQPEELSETVSSEQHRNFSQFGNSNNMSSHPVVNNLDMSTISGQNWSRDAPVVVPVPSDSNSGPLVNGGYINQSFSNYPPHLTSQQFNPQSQFSQNYQYPPNISSNNSFYNPSNAQQQWVQQQQPQQQQQLSINPSSRMSPSSPLPPSRNSVPEINNDDSSVLQLARQQANSLTNPEREVPNNRIIIGKSKPSANTSNAANAGQPMANNSNTIVPPVLQSNTPAANSANLFASAVRMYNNVSKVSKAAPIQQNQSLQQQQLPQSQQLLPISNQFPYPQQG